MKHTKTNAMRILDKEKVPYQVHEYETADGLLDGVSVAHKTGQNEAQVFKTLVTRGSDKNVYVFCIPVAAELPLKTAAKAAGVKSIQMLPVAEITPVTGYKKGGCSPLGMKKHYPTFIEESAFTYSSIMVSGGQIGLQIQLEPARLAAVVPASSFSFSI